MKTLPPDTTYRRNVLLPLTAAGLLFFILLSSGWLSPERYLEGLEGDALHERLKLLFLLLFLPLLFGGIYAIRMGRNILESGQFPPPGTKVIKATEIKEGAAARRYGYGVVLYGIALVAAFIYGAVYLPDQLYSLIKA